MSRHRGPAHYIVSTVLILMGIPVGCIIAFAGFPTPGIYIFRLFPVTDVTRDLFTLRLIVCGLVNSVFCYALIFALAAVVKRLRREKDPAAPSGGDGAGL